MGRLFVSYLLLVILGWAGVHRFYLGRHYTGALYLFTGGLLGVGVIIDFFMIPFMVAEDIDSSGGSVLDFLLKIVVGGSFFALFCFMVSFMLMAMLSIF